MGLGNQTVTPKLHSLQVTQSVYGVAIPLVAGTVRVPMNLLWYGDFNDHGSAYQLGGKGLGKSTQYDYQAAILAMLCRGPVSGIGSVWGQNGRLNLQSAQENFIVPAGGGSYTVQNQSAFNADNGVAAAAVYSVTANDYGSPGPVVLSGTQMVALTSGSDYTSPTQDNPGTYTFPAAQAGQSVTINYSYSMYVVDSSEDYIIPNTAPYEITVQNQPNFRTDLGVTFVDTGVPLEFVPAGTNPAEGQYSIGTSGGGYDGNYFFNAADATRPVVINYSWRQSYSSLNPEASLQFELLEGQQSQSPWEYLISQHLSQALGYSTLACVGASAMDLGSSGQTPNYNFEVFGPYAFGGGIVDADLAVWINAFLTNTIWGVGLPSSIIDQSLDTIARDYWNSNNFFVSVLLDQAAQSASELVDLWCSAGNVADFWSEGRLKFGPYGDTTTIANGYLFTPVTSPVVDLNDLDFLVEGNEDPIQVKRSPWQDAFNEVKVQFTDRINNYNANSVVEQDNWSVSQFGLRPEGQQDYSFLCTIAAATFAANIRLKRLVNIRAKYMFKISGIRYQFLEPIDLVTLTDSNLQFNKVPARIIQIEEDANRIYQVTCEEFPWGTATATIYPKNPIAPPPPQPYLCDPGNTAVMDIFEAVSRAAVTSANPDFQIWIALSGGGAPGVAPVVGMPNGTGQNWGGCEVWLSLDNESYEKIGTQYGTSRAGALTAALPAGSDPDTTDILSVSTTGQLFSVSLAQANAFSTLSKIGNEYISFQNATLTGSDGLINDYDLTYLRRGVFTTPQTAHAVGEPFVRCDSQIFQYSYDPSLAGKTIYLKFLSFNNVQQRKQTLEEVEPLQYEVGGINAATNMTVDAILAGQTATIRIYSTAGGPGTSGSVTLKNGAVVTLPADTQTGEALQTTYYVNFESGNGTYSFFTDPNLWLQDEITTPGSIRIGAVTTPGDFSFIPLRGGGTIAFGAGYVAAGSPIPLPSGYTAANMVAWTGPGRSPYTTLQFNGVLQSTQSNGTPSTSFQTRDNYPPVTSDSNWAAVAWTEGANVNVTTVGGIVQVTFTTGNGDILCVVSGTLPNENTVPVPQGFSAQNYIGIVGMGGTAAYPHQDNGMQGIQTCFLNSSLQVNAFYGDNDGNEWAGNVNVLGVFWLPGGGVQSVVVTGGTAITIPTTSGHQIAIIQAVVASGANFGVPPAFAGQTLVSTATLSSYTPTGSHICQQIVGCQTSGTTFTGTYGDNTGATWNGNGNIFAIGTI